MKQYLLILLAISALFISSCGDDDDDQNNNGEVELRHDGPNLTGPFLPAGQHEFLVHFDAADINQYQGRILDRIEFFLGELPAGLGVAVLTGSNPNFPDTEIYFRDISNRITTTGWQTHRLSELIEIGTEDIWFSIIVVLDQQQRSVGCDAGPRQVGGDWLLRETDQDFITFADVTGGGESVNWNIRGVLAAEQWFC